MKASITKWAARGRSGNRVVGGLAEGPPLPHCLLGKELERTDPRLALSAPSPSLSATSTELPLLSAVPLTQVLPQCVSVSQGLVPSPLPPRSLLVARREHMAGNNCKVLPAGCARVADPPPASRTDCLGLARVPHLGHSRVRGSMDTHTESTALPRKESCRRGTLGPGLGLPPRRRRHPRRQQTAQAEGGHALRNGGRKLLAELPWVLPLPLLVVCPVAARPASATYKAVAPPRPRRGGGGGGQCPAIHLQPLPPPQLAQLVALCQNSWVSPFGRLFPARLWMVYTEMSINPSPSALAKCQGGERAWKGDQRLMSWMGGLAGLSLLLAPPLLMIGTPRP